MADGTFWTLDSSKGITGKLTFALPASQPAYALVSVPATQHYPSGGTTDDDQGLGFGSTGTVTADATKGTVAIAFDRKFTIAAADNIPASTCEFTGTFEVCKRERQLARGDRGRPLPVHGGAGVGPARVGGPVADGATRLGREAVRA